MTKDTFILLAQPEQLRQLQGWDAVPAHLAYRIGRGPHLFRAGSGPVPQGGLMVVADQDFDGLGPSAPFCQEVVRECQARGFSGAVLDFEGRLPPLEQIAAQLDETFSHRGWSLYVPEAYGACAPHATVMIPSALSGGSLALRLQEARERFGRDRVALALQKAAEDFFLPSPTGSGLPLSREQLAERLERLRPAVFFSNELCARYFTYMSRESGAHFVLFDDAETLQQKLRAGTAMGFSAAFLMYPEVRDLLPRLFLPGRRT